MLLITGHTSPRNNRGVACAFSPPLARRLTSYSLSATTNNNDNIDNNNDDNNIDGQRQQGEPEEPEETETTARRSTRRQAMIRSATAVMVMASARTASSMAIPELVPPAAAAADTVTESVYRPAKRPTAYRVDSTTPPTLLPMGTARQQTQILKGLAAGSGTDKDAILVDTLNLNNLLNKAVFGTAAYVQSQFDKDVSQSGDTYASFVCLGVPTAPTAPDLELVTSLLTQLALNRPANSQNMALGLHWAPCVSGSPLLQTYQLTGDFDAFAQAMIKAGVAQETLQLYQPLLEYALSKNIDFIPLSPEYDDLNVALAQGLQNVDPTRRAAYVVDAQGFIQQTQEPPYRLYIDRSLFKDTPKGVKDGDFFAQRILVHETAATACAQFAKLHATASASAEPLVVLVAPTPDLRYLQGINGRIARVCQKVGMTKVTNKAVTTILCNPTAQDTLSKTRYLRLEIGTGPDTVDLQSKVADYLWFSQSPKVNLIPRLMDG